jgi:uncharacterized protein (TIGR00255 family)
MKSMTGYGSAAGSLDGAALAVRVSSVNRKMLDITVSLPGEWDALEQEVAGRVRQSVLRGKVHVQVECLAAAAAAEAHWDEAAVASSLERLAALAAAQGISFRPTPELLWQIANSHRQAPGRPTHEAARAPLLAALDGALHALTVMRAKEGEALLVDFLARVASLRRLVEAAAARAPLVAPAYREQLLRRLREAGLDLDVGDERVLKEIALFADRCDVSEEITRMRSHLDQFTVLLRSGGEIGRKAEFILQELGREAHTLGSKANDLAISRNVIELKNELERIREQIANVE